MNDKVAMTAQAGAVACDVVLPDGTPVARRVDIEYADRLLREYEHSDCRKANFLYPTPPAAVPVEALEGLVAKWREREMDMHHDDEAAVISDCRNDLLTLIKERSNG